MAQEGKLGNPLLAAAEEENEGDQEEEEEEEESLVDYGGCGPGFESVSPLSKLRQG